MIILLWPTIHKYFDNLFSTDDEFLKDIMEELINKYDLRNNYNKEIFWNLSEKEILNLDIEDRKIYNEFNEKLDFYRKKYFIPKQFKEDFRKFVITWNSELSTNAKINFSKKSIKIEIPLTFSETHWESLWKRIQSMKKEYGWTKFKLDNYFEIKRKLYLESIWENPNFSNKDKTIISQLDKANKNKRIKEFEKYINLLNRYN